MFSKNLRLIILIGITIFFIFIQIRGIGNEKNIKSHIKNCVDLNYEEINYINNLDYSELNFKVVFNDERKWKKNLLSDNIKSYENQKISEESLRLYSISKRQKGLIELKTKKLNCYFKANIRPHGNFMDHRGGLEIPSLNINLEEGNIKGITQFLLLRPETRNYGNEIFNTVLFKKFGFLSPVTFNSNLIYNNKNHKVIFQEKIVKELLENSDLRESFIAELDERFLWFDSVNSISFSKFGVSNHKLILKSDEYSKIAEYAISLLNDLDRINVRLNNDYTDYASLSRVLDKNYFEKLDIFDALIYAVLAEHGLQKDDRKFYFNAFKRNFSPIYYDGMGNLLTEKDKLSNRQINEITKFLPSAKLGSDQALLILQNIDLKIFKDDLAKMNLIIDKNDLDKILKKIESNLKYLSILNDDKLFKISINKKNEIINQTDSFNQKLIRKFVYYKENFNGYLECEFYKKNCKNLNLNNKNKSELLGQNLFYSDTNYIFTGSLLSSAESESFYYQYLDKIYKNNYLISNIENDIKIFHNKKIKIDVNKNEKVINIQNFDDEKVVFFDSNLKNWKIDFSKNLEYSESQKTYDTVRSDEFGLTGCLSFIDTKVENLNLKIEDMNCEDSVNFIRTKGTIKKIEIYNAKFDAIDTDFSELIFNEIKVYSSSNDCLDFSYGKYEILYANLIDCGDKAISVGEKSSLNIKNLETLNSKMGLAAKDSSKVKVNNAKIKGVDICLAAYKKKQEHWGGYIFINEIHCEDYNKFSEFDKNSKIEVVSKN